MAKLTAIGASGDRAEYQLSAVVVVGRAETSSLVLPYPTVSREHCRFDITDDGAFLTDLGSRTGTLVNGKTIDRALLRDGDQILIADRAFVFRSEAGPPLRSEARQGTTGDTLLGWIDRGGSTVSMIGSVSDVHAEGMTLAVAADLEADEAPSTGANAHQRLRVIYEVANAISSLHEPQELLPEVMRQIFSIFAQAERGFILLQSAKIPESYEAALICKRDQREGEIIEMPLSSAVYRKVIEERQAVLTADAMSDPRFRERVSVHMLQIRSMMAVPLICRGEVLGMINIDNTETRTGFTREDLDLLRSIAPQVAIAVKNAALVRELVTEAERRISLARYLSPDLVEKIIANEITIADSGELKQGTVFFSDIIGFTSLSEKLAPREVFEKLNRYFAVMQEIIFRLGGTVDKFQGDAIMAFWGVLAPVEGKERKAVQAALEMQNALYDFNRRERLEGAQEIRMGIGLNTGELIAGNVGSDAKIEYTVLGENVNLASRIEGQAGRYQVLISETTLNAIRPQVSAVRFPPVNLKNVSRAITLYGVRGIQGEEPGRMTLCMGAALGRPNGETVEVHIISGREHDGEGLQFWLASADAIPLDADQLRLNLQEKPSLAPVPCQVVPDGTRVCVMVEAPPDELAYLVTPGTVIESDLSLDELKRA